jgi:hypothetical protein
VHNEEEDFGSDPPNAERLKSSTIRKILDECSNVEALFMAAFFTSVSVAEFINYFGKQLRPGSREVRRRAFRFTNGRRIVASLMEYRRFCGRRFSPILRNPFSGCSIQ